MSDQSLPTGREPAGEVVVWLRVDADHGVDLEAPVLGMRTGGGLPGPIEPSLVPTDRLVAAGSAAGSYVVDPDGPDPAKRFKARGSVALTVAGGAVYVVLAPDDRTDLGFWLVEAAGELTLHRPDATGTVEIEGLGWSLELSDLYTLADGEPAPVDAADVVAALVAAGATARSQRPGPDPASGGGDRSSGASGASRKRRGAAGSVDRGGLRIVAVVAVLGIIAAVMWSGASWVLDKVEAFTDGGTATPATTDPGAAEVTVRLAEGLTVEQMLGRIDEQVPEVTTDGLTTALADESVTSTLRPDGQASYEGLLFPATYQFRVDSTATDLLDRLAAEMVTRVEAQDPEGSKQRISERYGLDLSTYDLLIVASMIQAEAGNFEEMPKVATVIYNRLADTTGRFPFLGIDAVDRYGAEREGLELTAYWDTDGEYNTRSFRQGLPPTPINSPGDAALAAAMNPAEGAWLWYSLTDPGVHTFSETQAEADAAKAICQQKGLCG